MRNPALPAAAGSPAIHRNPLDADTAWRLVRAAATAAAALEAAGRPSGLALTGDAIQAVAADDPGAAIVWRAGEGWTSRADAHEPGFALLDLYLPMCAATAAHPMTIGHLGQSLDGFIATHGGDSQFVTGHENIVHLHRLRALCDAVIVGAGTVAADDPKLTTRHVPGPSPLRVVFDPARRLEPRYGVFHDGSAETLYVCGRPHLQPGETHLGRAVMVAVDDDVPGQAVGELKRLLLARGFSRILVEGGGVTVSKFLQEGLLDRLQVAVAPFIIGDGRPAIRLPAPALLKDCERHRHRVFTMGHDVLFELVIRD